MGLGQWRAGQLREQGLENRELFHLTAIDNLPSIIQRGILPRNEVSSHDFVDISMSDVQLRRAEKTVDLGKNPSGFRVERRLHDLVPFYFTPRNPMTYKRKDKSRELCVLVVPLLSFCRDDVLFVFSDGNAAAEATEFAWNIRQLREFVSWDVIDAERWIDWPDGRRRRCAEFIAGGKVDFGHVARVVVASQEGKELVLGHLKRASRSCSVEIDGNSLFDDPAEAFYRESTGAFTPIQTRKGQAQQGSAFVADDEEPF